MGGEGSVYLPVIGQILLGAFFIFLAISHAMNWRTRSDHLRERNVILPTLVLWLSILLYFLGGLFLVFHLAMCTVVAVLSIMVIIRAVIMGNFWSSKGDDQHIASLQFMTNMALLGALLLTL